MRHLTTTVICAALWLCTEVFGAARVGQPAPDFKGALSNGATVSLPAARQGGRTQMDQSRLTVRA